LTLSEHALAGPVAEPGNDAASIAADIHRYFHYTLGRDELDHAPGYLLQALSLAVRDRLLAGANRTRRAWMRQDRRRCCYLSMEFLIGRTLRNALLNLDLEGAVREALEHDGVRLEEVAELEHDAGLGNGGLGRLAACFLDSCATLGLPLIGYGIRYRYGMFHQAIENGHQVERPDPWLHDGHPWEIERRELAQRVHFGGRSEWWRGADGRARKRWVDTREVMAVPYDIPIPGYRNGTVNTLRLWAAEGTDVFDLAEFNAGSYPEAVAAKNEAENITMVLYPNDASENGKELRLRQQYFLASASLKDALRHFTAHHELGADAFAAAHCFQLNDTHPSIAVAELMRLLVDEHDMAWDEAWSAVTRTMAYTNHTLLPEALERWPVRLLAELLPRVLEIIHEINARFLAEVARAWPGDTGRQRRMSIIEEGDEPMVRMAWLAIAGSFSVNGVAALHSRLLAGGLFRDFHELWPARFNNKTNGITPRRWLALCNPALASLITEAVGPGWERDLARLEGLAAHAGDAGFQERWQQVRLANKERLARIVRAACGIDLDAQALLDVQVKRIHEYKRQLLNLLHVLHLYCRIKDGDGAGVAPRFVLLAGKAAPGYAAAKSIIKLANNVAQVINADRQVRERLRVAFLPDYRVTSMEAICPAADLSQQISTAGKEASGTGNMKLMMNGAVTIGTRDGANIEILEAVGEENFFRFGLDAEQVARTRPNYRPHDVIESDERLHRVLSLLSSGHFNQFEPGLFDSLVESVRSEHDPWMTAADFPAYVAAHERAEAAWREPARWRRMSILNCARSGRFSSDRTIGEYNDQIWRLTPLDPRRP